jgi:DoxX-like family
MTHLGYPVYFCVILGAWKVLRAIAVLAPRFPRLKQWAYAGTAFDLIGAMASQLAAGWRDQTGRPTGVYRSCARLVVAAAGEPPSGHNLVLAPAN